MAVAAPVAPAIPELGDDPACTAAASDLLENINDLIDSAGDVGSDVGEVTGVPDIVCLFVDDIDPISGCDDPAVPADEVGDRGCESDDTLEEDDECSGRVYKVRFHVTGVTACSSWRRDAEGSVIGKAVI
jgi:hypothetical protein